MPNRILAIAALTALLLGAGTSWLIRGQRGGDAPELLVQGDYSDILDAHAAPLVLLTAPDCEFSGLARSHLALSGVAYAEISVDASPRGQQLLRERLAMRSVPVLLGRTEMLTAYDRDAMDLFLARQARLP